MQWHGWRIPVVLAALLAGLLILFGAQWLYNKYSFSQPLDRVLKADEAVESYTLEKNGAVLVIEARLREVPDLGAAYRRLRKSIQDVLGKRPFILKIKDRRDEELQRAFYNSQFALYEAQVRGNYREMIRSLENETAKAQVGVSVHLDQDNIYVQMKHGGSYLYEIIPRLATPPRE
ncbi:hypothetical protein GFC01_11490 [Desulfofundulus thermobenzoicus]|uniref:Uncharacterized protein n=1 Tax=Desulfofundulus thermobenzoicus TaxID=29376 RepID=A0A6N7ISF7_9FIRM|nr:hypothetical protein [Desulfofundulus thermobenzoicus]MQL52871.1 hypothetical protein [Desulfofundulus thermobenzoicus]